MNYASLASKTNKLLAKYGGTITIKRFSPGTYSPSGGKFVSASSVTCFASAVLRTNIRLNFGDRYLDGTEIVANDREMIISNGFTLSPLAVSDIVTIKSKNYKVITCLPLEPDGDQTLFFRALLRK